MINIVRNIKNIPHYQGGAQSSFLCEGRYAVLFYPIFRRLFICLVLSTFIGTGISVQAAPHHGDAFDLKQPDGTFIPVKVWGDEYYQRVESLDGYTLIRNSESWICYARLNADRSAFIATPLRYTGKTSLSQLSRLGITRSLRLNPLARQAKADKRIRELEIDEQGVNLIRHGTPAAMRKRGSQQITGDIVGLLLLIDFSDEPATITREQMDNFANQVGYTEFSNNGSVHDYYWDVSGQQLNYTNITTEYYRALQPKTYYDTPEGKARELVTEALNALDARGFDFSALSTNSSNQVLAVNVLHAGRTDQGWAQGLWPHSGSISSLTLDGVTLRRYQMTGIGTSLSIGTFCHENGHMVCRYPDLYDYDSDSRGVGRFCLMCSSGGRNPVPPCAPLRDYYTQWDTVTDISNASPGSVFSHIANSNTSFIYNNPNNANEAFYIESRRSVDRNEGLPDEGLIIWHWDSQGDNDNQQMTPESHYRVSLEQADGLFQMELDESAGDEDDLFDANSNASFNDGTSPDAHWWDGSNSGLDVANISEIGDIMTFTIGDYALALNAPNAGDVYYVNDQLEIKWSIFDSTIQNVKIQLSTDNGQTFTDVIASTANNGSYTWTIPDMESQTCIIKLSDTDDQPEVNSGIFTIKRLATITVSPISYTATADEGASTDVSMSIANSASGTLAFSITTASGASAIMINELFIPHSAFIDGIELWNRGPDKDMTGWQVAWNDDKMTSGSYEFADGFIFPSGKTVVIMDDESLEDDSTFYAGVNLSWSTQAGSETELSIALLDPDGRGVDFFKTAGNNDTPPTGTSWNGDGFTLTTDIERVFRMRNQDNDDITDWEAGTGEQSINQINPGQSLGSSFGWLSASPSEGTVDSIGSLAVTLTFDATNLTQGVYTDTLLVFHDARDTESPIKLPCVFTVGSTGNRHVTLLGNNSIVMHNHNLIIHNSEKLPVSVALYDIRGRMIVQNRFKPATTIIRMDNARALATGTYIYSIKIGSKIVRQRFIVSK